MELGLKTVGFEDEDVSYSMLMHWAEQAPEVEFVGIQSDISGMRMIKTQDEIDIIQKAVDIGDAAFSHILGHIKPGVTEIEIAAELEYFMRKSGALKPSFETIAISGTKTSMPHGMPDNKKIEPGDPLTMDFGCVYEGYCSDMTRTVFIGNPCKELKDIYDLVLKTQVECQKSAFAGMTGTEVDAISREIIYGAGFEGCYDHGLGHSVGIDIHENPRFNTKDDTVMENGMVMTVEPGVYVAGLGGVRIENMIVINDDNPINLTHSTKEMIIL
jgi:Xaa-Pro aminopeptidase